MSCWVTRKRQGSPKRKLFTLTELGWTLKEIFYTPKGSLFPWKECPLFNRIASFSEEV